MTFENDPLKTLLQARAVAVPPAPDDEFERILRALPKSKSKAWLWFLIPALTFSAWLMANRIFFTKNNERDAGNFILSTFDELEKDLEQSEHLSE